MKRVYLARSLSGSDSPFVAELAGMLASRGFESTEFEVGKERTRDSQVSPYAAILASDLVVALVDRPSPSVYLEIGVAIGAGKPVILIADLMAPIPSDLVSVPYVPYSRDSTKDLAALENALSRLEYPVAKALPRKRSAAKELGTFAEAPDLFAAMDPDRFEDLVAKVMRKKGWVVERAPAHLESRCDFLATRRDKPSIVVIEAKKLPTHSRVSLEQVHRLREAVTLLGAVAGLLISSSGFTSSAIALAAEKGPQLLLLSVGDFLKAKTSTLLPSVPTGEETPGGAD